MKKGELREEQVATKGLVIPQPEQFGVRSRRAAESRVVEVEEVDLEVEFFVEEAEEAEEIAAFLRVSGIKREAEVPVTTYPKLSALSF